MEVRSTDGVTIVVHDLGGGPSGRGSGKDREPLLVSHATGFCGRTYEPLAAALTDRFHVHAIDYRAHGDSTSPANRRFDWEAMAEDLEAAMDALDLRGIPVVGHSMGGAVAMLVETRRPGTFRAAWLFEPIITPPGGFSRPPGMENPMAAAAARRRAVFPSKAEALLRYASKTPLGVLRADALAAYVEHGFGDAADGTATLKCPPEDEAATFSATGAVTIDAVRAVTIPVVVAIGHVEREMGPAMMGPMTAEAMPDGRLVEYPTLGHFGPLQDPTLVAAAIREFFERA